MIADATIPRQTDRFPDLTAKITPNPNSIFMPIRGGEVFDIKEGIYEYVKPGDGQVASMAVAVKYPRPGSGVTKKFEEDLQKLIIELGDKLSQLGHPNIVKLLGVNYSFARLPSFVMPFYAHNIITYMEQQTSLDQPLTDRQRLDWTNQIASAMMYLHTRQPPIIHGNLRGVNVLVDNATAQCLIADVGMNEVVSDSCFKMLMSPARASWTAPELMSNLKPIQPGRYTTVSLEVPCTTQTDVFAFAVTLIEVYGNGVKPFGAKTEDFEVITLIEKGERPNIPQAILESQVLAEVVTRCWAIEPTRRPTMVDVCVKLGLTSYISQTLGY